MQKKKLVALLLLVAMLFTLVPTAAMAGTEAVAAEQEAALFSNSVSITVTSGSAVQLFSQQYERKESSYTSGTFYDEINYYGAKTLKASDVHHGDGTDIYMFSLQDTDKYLSYRVSKEGYITKAGYLNAGDTVEAIYTDADQYDAEIQPTVQGADWMENGVLLNVNGQNNLQLQQNDSYRLRAYRSWQIINDVSSNRIVEPDFHYTVLSGSDVIESTPVTSGNAKDNWLNITAKNEGTAIIEVTYDAISINGSTEFSGIYGSSAAKRTGLLVVQVGNSADDVDFGVACNSSSADYTGNKTDLPWDSEFDTLYFVGESGTLQFAPTVTSGKIAKVEYSNDKGVTWQTAVQNDSGYMANIVEGNNLLRVTKDDGSTAFQVIRGSNVDVRVTNRTHAGEALQAGDKVRVTIDGLYLPAAKMSGIYNPAYDSEWGLSAARLSYTFGENRISVEDMLTGQYNFSTRNNYLEVTLPVTDAEKYTLTGGYITGESWGKDLGEHRKLTDNGMPPDLSANSSKYTRSILPDITVYIGQSPSANRAPELTGTAKAEAAINQGDTYRLFVNQFFTDADNDALTYSVSVNGAAAQATSADYQFKPDKAGTYTLVFKANDGQADSPVYKVTLTVKESSSSGGGDVTPDKYFDMGGKNIAGYVTMSVEDRAKRPADSKVPVALGTIIAPVEVPYAAGENIAQVAVRLFKAYNIDVNFDGTVIDGFYLKSMRTSSGWLGEFDAGSGSGWMFTQNGTFPNVGAADCTVADGDVICWKYTSALGEDIGGGSASGDTTSGAAGGKVPAELPTTGAGVTDLITSIGSIDKSSGELLQAAREAYDKLTAEEQKLVKNYDRLLAAEREYGRLTNPLPFNDVKEQHWAREAIQYVYSKDLMNGTKEAAFEPEAELSRAMLVTILYRLEGAPAVTAHNSFSDVTDRDWFTNAVLWANANKIVSGYGNGAFGANDAITREQLASVLMRYSQYKQYDTSKKANLNGFADKDQISSWAEGSVAWAKAEGLLNGRTASTIAPQGKVTRAETAAILMRYLQK